MIDYGSVVDLLQDVVVDVLVVFDVVLDILLGYVIDCVGVFSGLLLVVGVGQVCLLVVCGFVLFDELVQVVLDVEKECVSVFDMFFMLWMCCCGLVDGMYWVIY